MVKEKNKYSKEFVVEESIRQGSGLLANANHAGKVVCRRSGRRGEVRNTDNKRKITGYCMAR